MITRFLFSISTIFSSLFLLTACDHPTANSRPQTLPQDSSIQVYFNQNNAEGINYTDPYRKITRSGDNLEQIIIDTIQTAKTSVDIAVQEFRLPNLAQELAALQKKGVKVRVILENQYSRPLSQLTVNEINQLDGRDRNSYQDYFALIDQNKDKKLSSQEINQNDALVILKNANIPIINDTADSSKGSGLMHHKFILIDQQMVIVTSANFTLSDTIGDFNNAQSRGNANHLIKIISSEIAKVFTQEFNLMWQNHQFGVDKSYRPPSQAQLGQTNLTIKFSPNSSKIDWHLTSNGLIEKTLDTATQSVDLALFVFSEQNLANALKKRHQQNVTIRALIDSNFAFINYSEALDMLGVAIRNKCQYEKNNNPWKNPITTVGIPQLPLGDKLHHKFAVIDNQTVITGSHNWSASANYQNDETLLIIQNPIIAAHFKREFERLYKNASLGVPKFIQDKIKQDNKKCKN
ncbi:phospholipase D-like domain-containing protein [Chroococcus sp. FPU101]|uniref:phospholipase D-like domain-containing protein n=1 Tax=Chroococcus sp. FPU101 TaxID=1974212 RepID=UPI001A8E0030|nr:phospholipase D-like domain-containing protein [Chroococcus sp. FPU101]GFE68880.1 helix-hairpin-helix motif protein [Chroococcus sp. FPU101]